MTVTAQAIVDLIRAQRIVGIHSLDNGECLSLVENYAAVAAACARVEATEAAHESSMRAFDACQASALPSPVRLAIPFERGQK